MEYPKESRVGEKKSDVLQGTLDLMVLKTLYAMGPLHGFGIARRIEQLSEEVLQLNEGTVYTSLLRLLQQGWIDAEQLKRQAAKACRPMLLFFLPGGALA